MKKNKYVALLLVLTLLVSQLIIAPGAVSAASYSTLTGRSDFMFGVNIRGNNIGSSEYKDTYQAIIDAKSLGSNIIRVKDTNSTSTDDKYFLGLAEIAAQKGMQIMFQQTSIHAWVLKDSGDDKVPCSLSEVKANKSAIINYYTNLATTYKGKVAYYQIGNEMDADSKSSSYLSSSDSNSGRTAAQFVDLKGIALGIHYAKTAIKAVDPDAKIVVNTSWKDSGFITKLKSYYYDSANDTIVTSSGSNRTRLSWDYTGLDAYAKSGISGDYSGVLSDLTALSEPVILTEVGLTPEVSGTSVSFTGDADWLATFLQTAYNNSKIKGFISFELYDNYSNYGASRESYHGLIDSNGKRRTEYGVLQKLYGGSNVTRPNVGAVDSTSEMAGDVVEYLDQSVNELSMYKIFSSSGISNVFFNDSISETTSTYGSSTVLEFDMYVEDADAFKSALATSERSWFVALFGPNNTGRYAMNLSTTNIEKSGWNHIVLSRSQFNSTEGKNDLDGSTVTKISVGYESNSNYTNPASGLKVAFANFCFTSITSNQKIISLSEPVSTFPENYKKGKFGNYYSSLVSNSQYVSSSNIEASGYMEFDVYIDNYTNLMKSLKTDANGNAVNYGLGFSLSESGSNATSGVRYSYDITKLITHSGWNHIVLIHTGSNKAQVSSTSSNSQYRPITPYLASNYQSSSKKRSYCLDYIDYSVSVSLSDSGYDYAYATGSVSNPAANDFFALTYLSFSGGLNAPEINISDRKILTQGDSTAESPQKIYKDFNMSNSNNGLCLAAKNNSEMSSGSQIKNFKITEDDVKYADYIEFDLFVESAAYLEYILDSSNVVDHGIYFQVQDEQGRIAQYNIRDQIKLAGWNHIIMPRISASKWQYLDPNGYFTVSKAFSKVFISPGAGINAPAANNDQNFKLIVANLITTVLYNVSTIENPETVGTVVGTVLGGVRESDYSSSGSSKKIFSISGLEAVNISQITSGGMIEFDFWVEDAAALKSAMAAANATFQVAVYGNDTYRAANAIPVSIIKNDGWNHVVIPKTNFAEGGDSSLSAVTKIVVNFYDGTPTAANGMHFAIANFCGTTIADMETVSTVGTKIAEQFTAKRTANLWNNGSHSGASGYFPIKVVGQGPLDLSSYMGSGNLYMEFDIYISDYESFKTAVDNGVEINYYISSHSSAIHANYYKYDFSSQIYKDGWNHIVLKVSGRSSYNKATPTQTDGLTNTSVKSYGFRVEGLNDTSALWNNMFAVTDLIFTTYSVPANSTDNAVISSLTTTNGIIRNFTNRSGGNPSYDSTGGLYGVENLGDYDFSTAEFVEFDVFIEQYAIMNKEVNQQNLDLVLHLNPNSSLANGANTYIEYGFWDQITQPGWNHIVAPISEWTVSATAPNMASISSYRLKFTGATGTNGVGLWFDSSTPDSRMGIYNIQATVHKTAPDKLATNYISIGNDDMYDFDFSADFLAGVEFDSVNIFGSNVIELDVYIGAVLDSSVNPEDISFWLLDTSGEYLIYYITPFITEIGWNHVFLRIDSFDEESGGIDLSDISTWYIVDTYTSNGEDSNVATVSGQVANVYATYNESGDVNRDDYVNIKDLIRTKKILCGTSVKDYTADVTSDRTIDVTDLKSILSIILN